MTQNLKQPFTNVQLELLKTFSYDLSDDDLLDLKKVIAAFFAKKLIREADNVWENESWTDEKTANLLHTKLRKSNS